MNAIVHPVTRESTGAMSSRRVLAAYLAEARSECVRYLRSPGFMLPLVLFSSIFYIFFGVVMGPSFGHGAKSYFLASYSVFGVMAAGLFGFGVSVATERDNGLLMLKRALPMPRGAYLIGKMIMAMAAAALVMTLMLLIGGLLGHVAMSASLVIGMLVTGVLGVLPFCALGMWIGSVAKGQVAPGVINLVYLPMAFLSGLWIPLPQLPAFFHHLAPVFPSYHLEQIMLDAANVQSGPLLVHVLVLVAWAGFFLGLAVRRLRRHG